MFLDVLRRRNPPSSKLRWLCTGRAGFPANAYVLDLDAVEANARLKSDEADRLGLKIFAMTKQVGRSSSFCQAVKRGGIDRSVAVDMACARATHKAGLKVGHLGHLQQMARHEAAAAASDLQARLLDSLQRDQGQGSGGRRQGRRGCRTCWHVSGGGRHLLSWA